jgi:NAD(P)-dependent dehydrogenase (short-subunit alcohol dehydrogenase family)
VETAVVTGAGRGLGRAIAGRLAGRGLEVTVADLDPQLAEQAASEIGGGATAARVDVRDPAALRDIARQAAERGRLAVWVNNAGVLRAERIWEHSDETIELMVATNLLGVVHGSRAAVEVMRAGGGGRVLNVASLSSLSPAPGEAVYGAAKQGALAFSIALQAELRMAGVPVEVRSICPDGIATDMLRQHADRPQAALSWSGPRLLSADEVADRALEVLDGDTLVASMPHWRGALARGLGLVPGAAVRMLPAFQRFGEWKQRRWRQSAARGSDR